MLGISGLFSCHSPLLSALQSVPQMKQSLQLRAFLPALSSSWKSPFATPVLAIYSRPSDPGVVH